MLVINVSLEAGFQSGVCLWARTMSWGHTYRFLLFHFMWFLMSKRESADPRSSIIKKTPLIRSHSGK